MERVVEQARRFVLNKGTATEKARFECLVDHIKPSQAVIVSLANMQNEDGGFPFNLQIGLPSTITDTCFILTWLGDLKLLDSDIGGRAFQFLLNCQKKGYWREKPALAELGPPAWMDPKSEEAAVFATAYVLFWLHITNRAQSITDDQCYHFLMEQQVETGRFNGFIHNTWLSAATLACHWGWDIPVVQKAVDFLTGIPADRLISSQITWMLWSLKTANLPAGYNNWAQSILAELYKLQRPDGSFQAEDGSGYAVNATIEAVKVLDLFS